MKFTKVNGMVYLTFDIFPKNVVHAIFTRQGGHSPEPWGSLNVGGTVGDDQDRVIQNSYICFDALRRDRNSLFDVRQVHSSDVVIVNSTRPRFGAPPALKADGMVTDKPSVSLFMRFADCTPILLYDPVRKVVGIVHAGWQGTIKQIARSAVKSMESVYGSKPEHILAAIGPSIGPDHYEIGQNVIEQVRYSFSDPSKILIHNSSRTHFDLWEANKQILNRAGVYEIETSNICTACNLGDWYSHRAQNGITGRFGALIGLSE